MEEDQDQFRGSPAAANYSTDLKGSTMSQDTQALLLASKNQNKQVVP